AEDGIRDFHVTGVQTCALPISHTAKESARTPECRSEAMKVLVVDDHPVVRQGVQRLLSSIPNATVLEAATGHEALALARKENPRSEERRVGKDGRSTRCGAGVP